ncbi:D-glucuronyl C5-epimerase B [Chionoecetes opilio]|uniref:heparosan-N-sulfate-glucuronate 5-epimerase n=1 Tax=Chionoecetes opilio TaxID=41210 RepID=A0A8J4YPU9_CHIOP|nr:D-glucuronyl C5-epimerase B [Chionoecetes opilio]
MEGVGQVGGGGDESYLEVEYGDPHHPHPQQELEGGEGGGEGESSRLQEIPCVINRETEVSCRREQSEVFVPFSFLHSYFEVYGQVEQKEDGREVFEWSHSYSRVYEPSGPYAPTGTFLNFELYNVEARERVKCISGRKVRVPISTQWQSSGYTYPIQIAQFGLSHYCKHLTEDAPQRQVVYLLSCVLQGLSYTNEVLSPYLHLSSLSFNWYTFFADITSSFSPFLTSTLLRGKLWVAFYVSAGVVVEDGDQHLGAWQVVGGSGRVTRTLDPTSRANILRFRAPESPSKGAVVLSLADVTSQSLLVVSLSFLAQGNASFSVAVEFRDKKTEVVTVHYIRSDRLLQVKDRQIYYGLGEQSGWRRITRNLLIDVHKAASSTPSLRKKFKKVSRSKLRLLSLTLSGSGSLTNVTVASAEHLHHFYDAADWLLRHQDQQGGWSIPVPRKVISGVLELGPGWYSAMAQGQAMSLLVRAAHHSGDPRYLRAAAGPQHSSPSTPQTVSGVRTYFPGGSVWYEEYPTNPSLFVLNGFIYSLLGLYDLKEFSNDDSGNSRALFESGMKSLKTLLPLYDTGWGSLYDLRHFTTHVAPNRARWDYHTTHITQLLLLASLDPDPILSSTALRWKDYMNGHKAKHN